jgi:hypothetical protein
MNSGGIMGLSGAGGTSGGLGRFFIGLIMIIAGGYLFFNSIYVTHNFSFGTPLFSVGGFHLTSGLVLIPFIFGIGLVFFNSKNYLGWALVVITLIMLLFGVISSIHFRLRHMTAFELLLILGLFVGGIGLFLSSLRKIE